MNVEALKTSGLDAGRQREMLSVLLRRRMAKPRKAPLSFAQQRLWFLDRYEPGNPFYTIPAMVRLRGELDAARLLRALRALAARHETLRTLFQEQGGEPRQVILPELPIELPLIETASEARPADRAGRAAAIEQLHAAMRAMTREGLDLARGPLWRAKLARLELREHVLLLAIHHIIADGWSLDVFVRDLAAAYGAQPDGTGDGHAAGGPAVAAYQYAHYAQAQHEQLRPETLAPALEYWRERLAGLPALALPTDRPRPAVKQYEAGWVPLRIGPELARRLRQVSREAEATPYMTLLAAWFALLARWSGQDDLAVGSPLAGRTRAELEGLIGFFVNMLVLRIDAGGRPSFRELLARARQSALGAFQHGEMPFEKLVEQLQPAHDPSRNPLFQVAFALQSAPRGVAQAGGIEFAPLIMPGSRMGELQLEAHAARFDLECHLWEDGEGYAGSLVYDRALFAHATAARMAAHYEGLLEAALLEPDRALAELPMMSDEEYEWLIAQGKGAPAPPAEVATVLGCFESNAVRYPEAIAATESGREMSYAALDRAGALLARRLRGCGVTRGDVAALALPRGIDWIAAQLGVMKAGAAWLPLDPALPRVRLEMMLAEARARVLVVARAGAAEGLALPPGCAVLALDGADEATAAEPDGLAFNALETPEPPEATEADDLAYVIYTSGSTGVPKGVEVPHRGLLNLVQWHRRAYALGPADRVTQLAAVGFDACVWEIWPALASGASVHVVPDDVRADAPALWSWMAREAITIAFAPTPLAEALLREPPPARPRLRALLTGGDRLHAPPPPGLPFTLYNNYGPTENSVVSTWCAVPPLGTASEPDASPGGEPGVEPGGARTGAPPIGRPVDGVRAYVVDREGRLAAPGVVGELWLGGASLARGYRGRPELTAERFVDDPVLPGERVYRTGDLVRWVAGDASRAGDATLQFCGRNDDQVKLRGVRIELGEIEAALRRHPIVREAAVALRAAPGGRLRLLAWVACDPGEAGGARLRDHLRGLLPEIMVPEQVLTLERLPLTAHGKVDAKALPDPPSLDGAAAGEPPRGELESALAAIWREVLGREAIARDESFFDLGGHSLLATQMLSRVRERLGCDVPLRQAFARPTLAGLAERVAAIAATGSVSGGAPAGHGREEIEL